MLAELVLKNRSYRRFYEKQSIDVEVLKDLVNLAGLSASRGNAQPLKYVLSANPEKNALIFPHLTWAALLKDWRGPEEGERPAAYIIVLGDTEISRSFECDLGIAAQTMLLGATEKGFGGCMIGSIAKDSLRESLNVASRYEILLVLALGKPKENVRLERIGSSGSTKYWRDEAGVHHVPKRYLEDIIIG
jgi:nitroreductase